jgi:hypothetical protein
MTVCTCGCHRCSAIENSKVLDYYIIADRNPDAAEEALGQLSGLLTGPPSPDRDTTMAALRVSVS